MIPVTTRRNQHLAVFGLGLSGLMAARALGEGGAVVAAWDDDADRRAAAKSAGVTLVDPRTADWGAIDGLVLSPGVPLTHPKPHDVVLKATEAGCAILGDIELLAESRPDATFVGCTGTNGKSTTTSLIGHILGAAGRRVEIGGNLGPPALGLDPLDKDGIYVLELSSYQLDLTHAARFDVAVFLNLTPDHLDRHGDMDGYLATKRRIFRDRDAPSERPAQVAVIGVDDAYGERVAAEMAARPGWVTIRISSTRAVDGGVYVLDGALFDAIDGAATPPVCDLSTSKTLPGVHNWQNAAASFAAARMLGIAPETIAGALASFPGLPHRQELVATLGGVRYVNDSKATNGEAASRALACYDDVYLIAGGLAKEGGLSAVLPLAGRIRHAFLIGEAAAAFEQELADHAPTTRSGTLEAAIDQARAAAETDGVDGAVVLLSPACASFDQWPSFVARGDAFRRIVQGFAGEDGA